jgi:nucleotide sugar dehydrogenase
MLGGTSGMKALSRTIISIFGMGRVGLVTAVCFARKGYRVIGIDPDKGRLSKIREAEPVFFEPKLLEYQKEAIESGNLSVTNVPILSAESNLVYVTVPTPNNDDGSINLEYLKKATTSIGQSLRRSHNHQIVMIKSTVTPGTTRNIVKRILESESDRVAGRDFRLCSNPEFLREGKAIHDTEFPDRIILGSDHAETLELVTDFYKDLYGQNTPPIVSTSHENAEIIKYANNTFLAMKVSFINTIANIAERFPGGDVKTIAAGIGLDDRICPKFLDAGLGWGGSCFPKDLTALLSYSKMLGYTPDLIEATLRMNNQQKRRAVEIARDAMGSLDGKRIGILGLSFKPDTDDMRDAVSVEVIGALLAEGANVVAYDPAAEMNARVIFGNRISYAQDIAGCISNVDCAIVVTEWPEIAQIRPSTFLRLMRQPLVIDGRRVYDAKEFLGMGVRFFAIGLGPVQAPTAG